MSNFYSELSPPPRRLLGPGPVDVDPRVLRAMSMPLLGQFDPCFTGYMNEVMSLYRRVFCTDNRSTPLVDGAAPCLRARRAPQPVVGMSEAALMAACLRVRRVGLLTLGPALLPLYRARVDAIGLAPRVVAWQAPQAPAAFDAAAVGAVPAVLEILADACESLRRDGAQAVVLAGAVLCGYAPALFARTGLPAFDGMHCAVGQARALLRLPGGRTPRAT